MPRDCGVGPQSVLVKAEQVVAPFSVVIPAYNEETVIERLLSGLLHGVPETAWPEIIVVCNGCTDATADRARGISPQIRVLELEEGNKPNALNVGNRAATALPRFFIDADVTVSHATLASLAEILNQGRIQAVAPRLVADYSHCPFLVRRYFETWRRLPYVQTDCIGAGVFGLSEAGLEKVGAFPDIIADDAYVRTRFKADEKQVMAETGTGEPLTFTVYPPGTLWDLIRIEARRHAGNCQIKPYLPPHAEQFSHSAGAIGRLAFQGGNPFDLLIYGLTKCAIRAKYLADRSQNRHGLWHRDLSSR